MVTGPFAFGIVIFMATIASGGAGAGAAALDAAGAALSVGAADAGAEPVPFAGGFDSCLPPPHAIPIAPDAASAATAIHFIDFFIVSLL